MVTESKLSDMKSFLAEIETLENKILRADDVIKALADDDVVSHVTVAFRSSKKAVVVSVTEVNSASLKEALVGLAQAAQNDLVIQRDKMIGGVEFRK